MQVDWTFIDSWVLAKGGAEKLATLRELRASR
jgi:hypothetical protein